MKFLQYFIFLYFDAFTFERWLLCCKQVGDSFMITSENFDKFIVYKSDLANSFLYAHCTDSASFMDGLADYILSEPNLLNYANTMTPIEFVPTARIYKKLYATISSFLNSELELLTFDDVTDEVRDVLGAEYRFIDNNGKTLIQNDKIGKIGEYTFHVLLTNYYKVHCITPKFRCTTDRNMSVFGIDSLFLDPSQHTIFFGESKVSKNIDNAITLINRSLLDYEKQISEEYKLVLSNDESFNLSPEFLAAFKEHTDVCITFEEFIKAAHIEKICVPTFIAHGNSTTNNTIEEYLRKMNTQIIRRNYFGLETVYLFISLPIIDKEQMMDVIMRKVVKKCNDYSSKHVTV